MQQERQNQMQPGRPNGGMGGASMRPDQSRGNGGMGGSSMRQMQQERQNQMQPGRPNGGMGGASTMRRDSPMGGGMGQPQGQNRMSSAFNHPSPQGAHMMQTPHGEVMARPNGHLSDVHDVGRGMDIHHGLDGSRRVFAERPDHSRVFAERGRPGFVERPYRFHDNDFSRRAYDWHGHEVDRFYAGYEFHGVMIDVYTSPVFYSPGFYGWVGSSWGGPVGYSWGFAANPWYRYYGFYFAPAPVYVTPADWLADYVISTNLANAYAAQQQSGTLAPMQQMSTGQPELTPEIKQQIADEVRTQIAIENADAQKNSQGQAPDPAVSSLDGLFSDEKPHIFLVSNSLDVVDNGGNECLLTDGDVLRTTAAPAAGSTSAILEVAVSKGGRECTASASVQVAITDLQEMENSLRATVDLGMSDLQANQGKKGLPAVPHSAMKAPVQAVIAQAAPPSETGVSAAVKQQLTLADQADSEAAQDAHVTLDAAPAASSASATINIAPGQTTAQVVAAMGKPVSVKTQGTHKIYKYNDIEVVFSNGKVVDVQ
jgi:hypothetical protein